MVDTAVICKVKYSDDISSKFVFKKQLIKTIKNKLIKARSKC